MSTKSISLPAAVTELATFDLDALNVEVEARGLSAQADGGTAATILAMGCRSLDEYAATILKPFVREQCSWCVQTHGDFQMLYYGHHLTGFDENKRERHRGHKYFDDCAAFCEHWDQASFDPEYDDLPIEFFAPMVREVFDRKPYDPAVIRAGEREPLTGTPRS